MKVLFIYNNYNDVRGISTVMEVAERFARKSKIGNFWVNTKPSPSIQFEEGSVIKTRPVSEGIPDFSEYDKVFIDKSIETFMETGHFGNKFEFYNRESFKS